MRIDVKRELNKSSNHVVDKDYQKFESSINNILRTKVNEQTTKLYAERRKKDKE